MVFDSRCHATIGCAPYRTNRKNGAQHLLLHVPGNWRYVEAFMLIPSARRREREKKDRKVAEGAKAFSRLSTSHMEEHAHDFAADHL
jgi:hypothetical protein